RWIMWLAGGRPGRCRLLLDGIVAQGLNCEVFTENPAIGIKGRLLAALDSFPPGHLDRYILALEFGQCLGGPHDFIDMHGVALVGISTRFHIVGIDPLHCSVEHELGRFFGSCCHDSTLKWPLAVSSSWILFRRASGLNRPHTAAPMALRASH